MDLTVENLCGLLKRSRLMPPESVLPLYDRWLVEGKDKKASPSHFTRWLVAQNLLTDYQANMLARGMIDDFFLGDYKILERVGRGRMAGVFKVQHTDGRIFAIKVLPPSRTKIPALMARFQREAELAVTFNHRNVVRSYSVGESKGVHYIVMELLDGETVEEALARRKMLPAGEAVNIIHQTLLGLQHLHEKGIVHRDLKPANLMLVPSLATGEVDSTRGRTVKILDIGLARRMFDEQTAPEKVEPDEVTREGVLLGTPDYLSPEQARDPRNIDIRSDIYSLGCVMYHLITGRTPFAGGNLLKLMLKHATEKPRPLADFVPGIPDGLQQILDYMMAKSADDRYPTPARAASALETFLVADEPATIEAEIPKRLKSDAKAARKSGKMPAPTVPAALPEQFELVPLEASKVSGPFDIADAPQEENGEIRIPPPRKAKRNRLVLAISAAIAVLTVAIGVVVLMIFRSRS